MMRVTIRPQADRDLDDIYDWIARDDPAAAERHVRRLVAAAMALRDFRSAAGCAPTSQLARAALSWEAI